MTTKEYESYFLKYRPQDLKKKLKKTKKYKFTKNKTRKNKNKKKDNIMTNIFNIKI